MGDLHEIGVVIALETNPVVACRFRDERCAGSFEDEVALEVGLLVNLLDDGFGCVAVAQGYPHMGLAKGAPHADIVVE